MSHRLAIIALAVTFAVPALADTRPFVSGSIAEIRAAHSGTPHLIALWSVDCAPCHQELPMLEAWHRANPDVRIVLIATDAGQTPAAIDAVLRRYRLDGVESWVFADDFLERLRHEVDPAWYGELPRSYLNDRQGSVAVSGRLERARLDAWRRAGTRAEERLGTR